MKSHKTQTGSKLGAKKWPTLLQQTTRHRESEEYRDGVMKAPYYESFPDGKNPGAKQEPGEDGKMID